LYLADLLLPDYSDADKMGHTKCELESGVMKMRYMALFYRKEMLYSDDQKLVPRL
jgi:hypothetical protein